MIPGIKIIDDILKGLPDNARLRADVTKLVSENEVLRLQVSQQAVEIQSLKDKYETPVALLPDEQWEVLRTLATKEVYWTPQEVSDATGITVVRVHSLLAKLRIDGFTLQNMRGFHISTTGRASLL